MTTTVLAPIDTSNETLDWGNPAIWSAGSVPNSSTADVTLAPVVNPQTGTSVSYQTTIQSAETIKVDNLSVDGTSLTVFGALNAAGTLAIDSGGTLLAQSAAATISAQAIENAGTITFSGAITTKGVFHNGGTIAGPLTINSGSFENAGTLEANALGAPTLNSSNLVNLIGTTLTGGTYIADAGATLALNADGPIVTDAATIILSELGAPLGKSATITALDPTSGGAIPLYLSLTTIAASGSLSLEDFAFYSTGNSLTVKGILAISDVTNLTAAAFSINLGGLMTYSGSSGSEVTGTITTTGGSITDDGEIIVNVAPVVNGVTYDSHLVIDATIVDSGSIVLGRGVTYGSPSTLATASASVELTSAVSANILFTDGTGSVRLDAPRSFTGKIETFTAGDQVVLAGVSLQKVVSYSYAGGAGGGTLTVQTSSGTPISLSFTGVYSTSDFVLAAGPTEQGVNSIVITTTSTVYELTASQAAQEFTHGNVTNRAPILDSGANIVSHLDVLAAMAVTGDLGPLYLTDSTPPTFSVTASQYVKDPGALTDIIGAYSLKITGVDAADAAIYAGLDHVVGITVSDSAADVSAVIDSLQTLVAVGRLSSIGLTDTGFGTVSVTAAQLANDTAALSALSGNYSVVITAPSSSQTIAGWAGHGNTVIFSGDAALYTVTPKGDGVSFTISNGTFTDQVSGVNAVKFGDFTDIVASQTPPVAGAVSSAQVTELYGAVLGRTPDVAGLAFYQTYAAANPTTSFIQYAQWFLQSGEYTGNSAHNYAQTVAGDQQFIADSYSNLLHRTASVTEIAYYENNVIAPMLNGITPGTTAYANAQMAAHAQVLVYFSQSPEFLSDVTITAQNPSSAQHWLLLI